MAKDVEVTKASAADIAANMQHHRETYGRFFKILMYSAASLAALLFVLFITLN